MELVFKIKENQETEALFVPAFQDDKDIIALLKSFNFPDIQDILIRLSKENFKGLKGQLFVVHSAKQIVVFVGAGKNRKLSAEDLRLLAGYIVSHLKKYKATNIGLVAKHWLRGTSEVSLLAQSLAEGLYLASYNFDKYKTPDQESIKVNIEKLFVYIDNKYKNKFKEAWQLGLLMAQGTIKARDLVNEPAGHMTPSFLAEQAIEIAKINKNIKVKIFDKEKIESMGMGAFLGIAQGSNQAPKFIHLIYKPTGKIKDKIALVGKGVTFDSGGLNIKTWEGMLQMKIDMGGAATVLGVFSVIAKIQPKVEVHGIIAACENMSSGSAVKPGDILTNMQGKTIEIANTDAEGRVTLSDSLAYAQKQGIKKMVDIATLTGSIMVALGSQYAGLFSLDSKMSQGIIKSSQKVGENMWQMPMALEYKDANESKIADIKNIGNSRLGGSIMAAWFLQDFISGDASLVHIDIAGPAYAEKEMNSYIPVGGVGFGVRTILDWLKSI